MSDVVTVIEATSVVVVQQAAPTVVTVVAQGPQGVPGSIIDSPLTGLALADADVVATDTPLVAFGKLQGQIDAHEGAGGAEHANVVAGGAAGFMTGADKTKLDGVATGATANSSDATLLARANHTGAQAISTVTGLQIALDAKQTVAAGVILQSLAFTDAGGTTASNVLTNVTVSAKTITPKSTNSTIRVRATFQGIIAAGGAGTNTAAGFRLYNNTAGANIGDAERSLGVVSSAGTNVQTEAPCCVEASIANAALTAVAFVLRARYAVTAANASATSITFVIEEIQN